MAKPQEILNPSLPVGDTFAISPTVSLRFRTHSAEEEISLSRTDTQQVRSNERLLNTGAEGFVWNTDVPRVSASMLRTSNLVGETLSALGSTQHPSTVDVIRLQLGTLAHHTLVATDIEGPSPNYFVTYVSRFPEGHIFGHLAQQDFNDLSYLKEIFRSRRGSERVGIVRPLASVSFEHDGRRYGAFTTEFNPVGDEVHVSYNPIIAGPTGTILGYPIYHHALNRGRSSGINTSIQRSTDAFKEHAFAIARNSKYGTTEAKLRAIKQTPYAKSLVEQQRRVVRADATLFTASGGKFPWLYGENSGDWMAEFGKDELLNRLTLMTARGGLKNLTEEEWVEQMLANRQTDSVSGTIFSPYESLGREGIVAELKRVKRALDHKES